MLEMVRNPDCDVKDRDSTLPEFSMLGSIAIRRLDGEHYTGNERLTRRHDLLEMMTAITRLPCRDRP